MSRHHIISAGLLGVLMLFMATCTNKNKNSRQPLQGKERSEQFIKMNKKLMRKDSERVENYIERRKWNMNLTGGGIWYGIYEEGKGKPVTPGDVVRFNYKVELLDGTLCYTSDSTGAKVFRVGHGGVEYGLEKGILLLNEGDKARFILTPYHAHGLLGDQERIPPHATIVYHLNLLEVRKGKPADN